MDKILSKSSTETLIIAKDFALTLKGGDIVALHGELGTGKTTFVKGLAETLGIEDEITSPTFSLMNVYPIQAKNSELKTLIHVDTYRLEEEQELIDIGVEDYLGEKNTICIIEWPEKLTGLLKERKIKHVLFEHMSENERKIKLPS